MTSSDGSFHGLARSRCGTLTGHGPRSCLHEVFCRAPQEGPEWAGFPRRCAVPERQLREKARRGAAVGKGPGTSITHDTSSRQRSCRLASTRFPSRGACPPYATSASSIPPPSRVSARGDGRYPRFAACSLRLMSSSNGPVTPRFPLCPDPVPRETVPSLLSRLAAMRRTEMAEFAQNMGVSVRRFLDGDPQALAGLVTWGGLSPAQLAELQFWSGEAIGEVRTRFRRAVFVSRALRNPVIRGCPVCLREDAQGHRGPPPRSWRCAAIGSCAT